MNHKLVNDQIVLATGNKGKVAEFSSLFEQYRISVSPQSEFLVSDVAETGSTFVENAIIKARHASRETNLPAIADDSGLVIDALKGAPGIYSARYCGQHGNDVGNYEKVLRELEGQHNRSARFLCVLVFMRFANDPTPIICQGEWHGKITTAPSGDGGFGYDPIFFLPEHNCTAAELDKSVKNTESHRAKALKQLMASFSDHL
ncbi:RdgB/HAM1 family non-canonical purine NTP pyrophosphatase [Glaciecola sp. XM2]|jgi:XTP/dITP diphosphohydrolase|uniref:RdgB/HAM1 family non-canonical purine NTP pyrophosphatase n=1 Tax=Glaciecola sp. XM2 TaxID=1914931 RepID=UPI001BDED2A9|nr:RdgB/HAM1 family non-canonical purine NTP pyrophosphatase [Glaciecola sp. XM2]MBT1452417.1 RdgB/HAM1 family non-canonical purine NTP pyrophosphatase [Glaciecola sp. XM2]